MTNQLTGVGLAAVVLALGGMSPARAGPLDLRQVPADAKWVAHLDADALRSSPVMQAFLKHCLPKLAPGKLSDASHAWPCPTVALDQLQGVTLFGDRLGIRSGAAIVQGKWDKEKLIKQLKSLPGLTTVTRQGHTAYVWTKHPGTDLAHKVALALPRPNLMVFAAEGDLQVALGVIDGKAATLQGKDSPLAAEVAKGTVLLARAAGLKADDITPQFSLFRRLTGLDYRLVDHEGRFKEELTLHAGSERVAENLKKAVDGALALAALAFSDSKDLLAMIDKAEVKTDGKQVRLAYQGTSDQLAKQASKACEAMRDQWQSRRAMFRALLGDDTPAGDTGQPSDDGRPSDARPRVAVGLAVEEMPNDGPHGGLIVRHVTPKGPAAKAGLKSGDVIVRVSNRQVDDYDDLLGAIAGLVPGEEVSFTVLRDREPRRLKVALGPPAKDGQAPEKVEGCHSAPYLGVLVTVVAELSEETASRLGLEEEKGVVVLDVIPGSPAARAGLRHGDLITSADGRQLRDPDALRGLVRQANVGQKVKLQVKRGERTREVQASLAGGPCDVLLFIPKGAPRDGEDGRLIDRLERRLEQLEKRMRELEAKQKGQ